MFPSLSTLSDRPSSGSSRPSRRPSWGCTGCSAAPRSASRSPPEDDPDAPAWTYRHAVIASVAVGFDLILAGGIRGHDPGRPLVDPAVRRGGGPGRRPECPQPPVPPLQPEPAADDRVFRDLPQRGLARGNPDRRQRDRIPLRRPRRRPDSRADLLALIAHDQPGREPEAARDLPRGLRPGTAVSPAARPGDPAPGAVSIGPTGADQDREPQPVHRPGAGRRPGQAGARPGGHARGRRPHRVRRGDRRRVRPS